MPPTVVLLPDQDIQLDDERQVEIDFLMPNGIYIRLKVNWDQPVEFLKRVGITLGYLSL